MNESLLALEQLRARYTPWTIALTAMTDRAPSGTTLTAITIDRAATFHIEGTAVTRDALLAFRDAVQAIPFSRDVTVPFSNLLQRERIDFSIDGRADRASIVLPSPPL